MGLNVYTVYDVSKETPSAMLRRMMAAEAFDETGYLVSFHPRKTFGVVSFRCRKYLDRDAWRSILLILERRTGKRVPRNERDQIEWCRVSGGCLPVPAVRRAGLMSVTRCSADFEIEVYAAEAFSKELAEFLHKWHENPWEWEFIEETKMGDEQ